MTKAPDRQKHETTLERRSTWPCRDKLCWYEDVRIWLADVARSRGFGEIKSVTTVKERPWSVVLQVEFEAKTGYFKASGAGGIHEPGLLLHLEELWAGHIPKVLAADIGRSWLLTADAGQPLREMADKAYKLSVLNQMLPMYAELQITSIHWVERLFVAGLPDRRLNSLSHLLEDLVFGEALADICSSNTLVQLRASVRQLLPMLDRCCTALAASPYAAAIDHGDLHTGNILVSRDGYRLCDWGDACVTHPFCSLGVTLQSVLEEVREPDRRNTAEALIAAYLEPWTALAPIRSLRSEFRTAIWVAHVIRALDFAHMLPGADEASNTWRPLIVGPLEQWVKRHALLAFDDDSLIYAPM